VVNDPCSSQSNAPWRVLAPVLRYIETGHQAQDPNDAWHKTGKLSLLGFTVWLGTERSLPR
jgi:hypothetical protein